MGNLIRKYCNCLSIFNKKQTQSNSQHVLVNLSHNPVEESQGKIQAQQISFVADQTIHEQSATQHEGNVNDVTLEEISNKQLSSLRSPHIDYNQPQDEQFILQEECKTNSSIDSPNSLPFKEGLLTYKDLTSINHHDITFYAQESLQKFIEEIENVNNLDEFVTNLERIDLYMSHYMNQKKMIIRIKFETEIGCSLEKFMEWSQSKRLFDTDFISDYHLHKINEQLSIGEMMINKHMMIKQQYLNYLKYSTQINDKVYIILKSIRLDDRYNEIIKSKDKQNAPGETYLILGGIQLYQSEKRIIMKGFIEGDFQLRVSFNLCRKSLRERVCTLVNKLKEVLE